ncbi:hypothetical protein B7486_17080 [cyanobacterium TDX16]|nr:hypothetical protein B7486_17080 [cyanobacterium TDX16]
MTSERFKRVSELFLAARELNPADRAAFLSEAASEDSEIVDEVRQLLSEDERPLDLDGVIDTNIRHDLNKLKNELESPPVDGVQKKPTEDSLPLARIGRYTLIRKIGEGGMGIVYEAQQQHPSRTVAVKIIRPGIASPAVLKRFNYEAQVLGQLQHPGIACIYEADVADVQQLDPSDASRFPARVQFFAMELIRGRPITEYATEHKLSTRDRLELLALICDAVHHAHLKGVIHRDLKPGNILVAQSAGESTDRSDHTGGAARKPSALPQPKVLDFGVARLTDADVQSVTLQTDIGQLVGTVPYMSPEQVLGDSRLLDIRSDVYALGVILYELLAGRLPLDVRNHSIPEATRMILEDEPLRLSSIDTRFRGDVETIVAKALEKDRERRYDSAGDMAADVRRYLTDQAITARPPTAAYRLRKFTKRNKGLFAAGIAIFVLLVGGIIGTSIGLARARAEAAISSAINDFLNENVLAAVSPDQQGKDVRMRDVLDAASARIEDRFKDQPMVEAAIRSTLGRTYLNLGDFPSAEKHLLMSRALSEQSLGPDAEMTLKSVEALSELRFEQGNYDEAEALINDSLARRRRVFGEDHPSVAVTLGELGAVCDVRGRYKDAARHLSDALKRQQRAFGDDDPRTILTLHRLAVAYNHLDRYTEAEELYLKLIASLKSIYGPRHPSTLTALADLAVFYQAQARFDEAIPLYREAVEGDREVLGEAHPTTLDTEHGLATLYYDRGKYPEAAELFEKNLEQRRKVIGPDHPKTLTCMNSLARVYLEQGRYVKAEPLCSEAVKEMRARFGQEPRTLAAISTLAKIYQLQNRLAEAEPLFKEVLDTVLKTYGENNVNALTAKTNVADTYQLQNRSQEAEQLTKSVVTSARKMLPPGQWRLGVYLTSHGIVLKDLKRFDEAETTLLEAHDIFMKALGAEHSRTIKTAEQIVKLYSAWSKPDQAARWRAQTATSQPAPQSVSAPPTAQTPSTTAPAGSN